MEIPKHWIEYHCGCTKNNEANYYPLIGYNYTLQNKKIFHIEEEKNLIRTLANKCKYKDPKKIQLLNIITHREFLNLY